MYQTRFAEGIFFQPVTATFSAEPCLAARKRISDGLVRLSVGLKDPRDIIADLERGFAGMG
jgi:cystathionine beta-lyase/cystathionine gamma-synthase